MVIDTVGVKTDRPLAMLDMYGTPYTRALHVVERYWLLDYEAAREGLERWFACAELAAVVSERLKKPGTGESQNVLIDIDKNGTIVILYGYAKDCPRPDPTPSQYCRRP
jgi:hypothetical protein